MCTIHIGCVLDTDRRKFPAACAVIGSALRRLFQFSDALGTAPLLTTFQRNRFALGQNAVTLLSSQLEGQLEPELLPMTGKMIRGNSCACGVDWTQLQTEPVQIREKQRFQILRTCLHKRIHVSFRQILLHTA